MRFLFTTLFFCIPVFLFSQSLTSEQLLARSFIIKQYTKADVSIFDSQNEIRFHCESPKALGIFSVDIPDETYTGKNRYYENNSKIGFPYTSFIKDNNMDWFSDNKHAIELTISEIIIKIKSESNPLSLGPNYIGYKQIWDNANKSIAESRDQYLFFENDQSENDCYKLATWAKDNAFIFLVGYNPETQSILTDNERHKYAVNVEMAFMEMDTRVPEAPYDGISEPQRQLQFHGKNLIMWLQAYDYMKAARWWPIYMYNDDVAPVDEDRNSCPCSMRNKLRMYSRNVYRTSKGPVFGVIDNMYGWKKNHGLMAAGALAMAAVVLNDAAVKWWWPGFKPSNWAELAHYGIDDNLFRGAHWFPSFSTPMADRSSVTGYAEGPSYFKYCFDNLLPAFRALSNFIPDKQHEHNYFYKQEIKNLFEWYNEITMPDGMSPSYDNSAVDGGTAIFGVMNNYSFNRKDFTFSNSPSLRQDFLLANLNNNHAFQEFTPSLSILPDAGNAIIRMKGDKESKHYFHMLFEHGVSIAQSASVFDGTHDDDDMGSFIISVDNDYLVMDPPYFSSPQKDKTNKYDDHNIIKIIGSDYTPFNNSYARHAKLSDMDQSRSFSIDYNSSQSSIQRLVQAKKSMTGRVYYVMNDDVLLKNGTHLRWQMNGNGSTNNSSFSYDNDRTTLWNHPCKTAGTWGIMLHSSFLDGVASPPTFFPNTQATGNNATIHSPTAKLVGGELHSRMEIFQSKNHALVQSILYPYRCAEEANLPTIHRKETPNYVYSTIVLKDPLIIQKHYYSKTSSPILSDSTTTDTSYDFHLAQLTNVDIAIADPFNIGNTSDSLKTDAKNTFLRLNTLTSQANSFCGASPPIKIKGTSLSGGTYVAFQDTNYIEADASMQSIEYYYVSKFRYEGYCSGVGNVTFYMPDLQYGFPMKASGEKVGSYYHNDTSDHKFISVYFSGPGKFVLELKDPCMDDCYFPPTSMTIDSVFNFNLGVTKTLAHALDIIPGDGILNITNMSRMSICPDNVLVNKDSIVMKMECVPERRWIVNEDGSKVYLQPDTLKYLCNREALLAERGVNETRNMIIVNERAGLVLDSGSVTHIGNNSTILIRPGGTLLIKHGATVIIGDSGCVQNRGELLADHGAYVCLEEGAVMKFYNDIDSFNFYYKDTIDRHLVYIAMPKGVGKPGAIVGVNPAGGRGKFAPLTTEQIRELEASGIRDTSWGSSRCLAFCDWKYKNLPHGVNNRPFGWCNISKPLALFKSPDTLCIGRPFSIDGTPSLNETGYTITVCKYDTGSHLCIASIDSVGDNGDNCLATRYLFTPVQAGYYRVRLVVHNDCSETDTFTKIVYVPNIPVANISISLDSICPGMGSLYANGFLSASNIATCRHRWTIEPILDDSMDINSLQELDGSRDWFIDSLAFVDSAFNFPGYQFTGGIRYLVSLTVWGWCSDSTVWDTVLVHSLRASIIRDSLKVYPDVTGYTRDTIDIFGSGYNGLLWSPTTHLNTSNPLHPIASPLVDTKYYLSAEDNYGCTVHDSIVVRSIYCAKAGFDKIICAGDSVHIGIEPPPPCDPWATSCTISNCFGGFLWIPSDGLDDPNSMYPKASPTVTTRYKFCLLNTEVIEEEVFDTIEFDEVIVYVDSVLSPAIEVIYQTDSTLYFTPSRLPLPLAYTYLWTFGDGDSSTSINPVHTFPVFDSVYRVCIAVTNACGTYTYCDSVHVDSSGLSGNGLGKRSLADSQDGAQHTVQNAQTKSTTEKIKSEVLLENIPNPFNESTTISYSIGQEYKEAELRITDVLGRLIKTYPLRTVKGNVAFDGTLYKRGLYYSALVVDGIVVKSKTMVIER